jgi:hypothetical protein
MALSQVLIVGELPCVRGLALACCLPSDSQGPLYRRAPAGMSAGSPMMRRACWLPTNESA